jgi:hypothetical protein
MEMNTRKGHNSEKVALFEDGEYERVEFNSWKEIDIDTGCGKSRRHEFNEKNNEDSSRKTIKCFSISIYCGNRRLCSL